MFELFYFTVSYLFHTFQKPKILLLNTFCTPKIVLLHTFHAPKIVLLHTFYTPKIVLFHTPKIVFFHTFDTPKIVLFHTFHTPKVVFSYVSYTKDSAGYNPCESIFFPQRCCRPFLQCLRTRPPQPRGRPMPLQIAPTGPVLGTGPESQG